MSLGQPRTPPFSQIDSTFFPHYGPSATHLWLAPLETRRFILHVMFLLLLSLEEYHAHSRVFLRILTSSLHLPYRAFQEEEVRIARAFSVAVTVVPPPTYNKTRPLVSPGEAPLCKDKAGRSKRPSTGLPDGSLTSNLIVDSLVASGIGSLPGGTTDGACVSKAAIAALLGGVTENVSIMGGFFGVFGTVGPNGPRLMARSMETLAKDVADFALVPVGVRDSTGDDVIEPYLSPADVDPQDRRMRFVFGLSGWIEPDDKNDDTRGSTSAWTCLGRQAEVFAVRCDELTLENLGTALETATRSKAWQLAVKEICERSSEFANSVSYYSSYLDQQALAGHKHPSVLEVAEMLDAFPGHAPGTDQTQLYSQAGSYIYSKAQDGTAPGAGAPQHDLLTYRHFHLQHNLDPSVAQQPAAALLMYCSVLGTLMEAHWPLSLLKISKLLDNPWHLGMVRADKAGATLAEAITRRVQGNRPVSLVGYSLGARAIYTCLMILSERRMFNMVDSVVMIGTPAPSESKVWLTLKSVVSGRLVNVYSETDYLLAFMHRTSNVQFGLAGVQAVYAEGIENHQVGDLSAVGGHRRYQHMTGTILRDIGWDDLDMKQVERGALALAAFDRQQVPKPAAIVRLPGVKSTLPSKPAYIAPSVAAIPALQTKTKVTISSVAVAAIGNINEAATLSSDSSEQGDKQRRRRRGRRGQGRRLMPQH